MVPLLSLWLPIILSAAAVFFMSSLVHMVLPHHKNDYAPVPNEDAVMDALRAHNIPEGEYIMPHSRGAEHMKSDEYQAKWKRGPAALLTIMPNQTFGMGSQLLNWFVYLIVIGIFVAYISSRALAPGADYVQVFRMASTVAFLGYAGALWQQTIWYRHKASTSFKSTLDSLAYALITGGFFGWLWP
jgi:hypothetical protein